ncbi:hypothetical protein Taro_027100 [Colocasia esculenta]|uniref:Leucine-rich repeat-containing N-terminal plant-type domain-containing protein n=1 Tax=Colocasia esculenta TaxID=4460 RepID=A0A843VLI0_COLES|nr:hypothetical protein [Colocasia esculenta]
MVARDLKEKEGARRNPVLFPTQICNDLHLSPFKIITKEFKSDSQFELRAQIHIKKLCSTGERLATAISGDVGLEACVLTWFQCVEASWSMENIDRALFCEFFLLDRAALQDFRAAVGRSALSWNDSLSPCSWQGVVCELGCVTQLRLPGVGLMGTILAGVLGNLTELRTLSLRFNTLSGTLLPDLASLVHLRNLYLQDNSFSGQILASIFSLQNLLWLNLGGNRFSGGISSEFGNLKRLCTLYFDRNQISGQIPDVNFDLDQFNVSYNRLNGSIPWSLQSKPTDTFMDLVCEACRSWGAALERIWRWGVRSGGVLRPLDSLKDSCSSSSFSAVEVDQKTEGIEDMGADEIEKEIRNVKRQSNITHGLLSVMIILTAIWQLSSY